jgi:type I restriction enzyme S subunit
MAALSEYLTRAPRYGIGAAAVRYRADLPTYIRITDIDEFGRFRPDPPVSVDSPLSRNYLLQDGDLVIARTGASVGKSYRYRLADGELVFAGFLVAIRPDHRRLDPRYLGYVLQSKRYWDWVASESMRSGQPGVNAQQISRLGLDAPAIEEQRAIAHSLEDADQLIESLERLTSKKRDIRQGLMQELLTGRIRLAGFLADWPEVLLGDHVSYVSTVALSRDQLDRDSPLRYLHYGDIHTRSDVRLDAVAESMPRASAWLAGRAGRLAPGDVVFADASEDPAGVGKSVEITAVPPEGVVPGLHTIAARFDKRVLADGFKAYLQFMPAFRESLLRLAAGTKVLATTRRYISSVRLQLPHVEEQAAIAAVLIDTDSEIAVLERRLASARSIKTGMMQELLTGRTRLPVEAAS